MLAAVVLLVVVLAELLAVVVPALEVPGAVGVVDVVTAVALALLARVFCGAALEGFAWDELINIQSNYKGTNLFGFVPSIVDLVEAQCPVI